MWFGKVLEMLRWVEQIWFGMHQYESVCIGMVFSGTHVSYLVIEVWVPSWVLFLFERLLTETPDPPSM